MAPFPDRQRVAVLGAGISGLAAAYRLHELDPSLDIAVLEASDRVGGVIHTRHLEGFCLEYGPDSLLTQVPWGLDLCRRLGIAGELVPTQAENQGALIIHRGRLRRLPDGLSVMAARRLVPLLMSPILSVRGKLRMACEYFVPRRRESSEESLTQFVTRRLGREAFERLVQPLVSGIYMGSPDRLSVRATFPRFVEMEEQHGGLLRAARAQRPRRSHPGPAGRERSPDAGGPEYGMFVAPRRGMGQIPQAIAARLPAGCIRLGCSVQRLSRQADGRWQVVSRPGPEAVHAEVFDALVVATAASAASRLLQEESPALAGELRAINHSSCVVVNVAFRREQLARPLDAFGFVSPLVEHRFVTACTFTSAKYPDRAPSDACLLRAFLGGAANPQLLDWSEEQIRDATLSELRQLLGICGQPSFCDVRRLRSTMPQYELGHLDRVQRIEHLARQLPGLALAGNAYHGAGVAHCIQSGQRAAGQLLESPSLLNRRRAAPPAARAG